VLRPTIRKASRWRVPQPVAAALVLLAFVLLITAGFRLLQEPAANWMERAPLIAAQIRYKMEDLRAPMAEARRAAERMQELANVAGDDDDGQPREVVLQGPGLLEEVTGNITEVVLGFGLVCVLLYFLLAAGDTFIARLIEAAPNFREQRRAATVIRRIENDVSDYLAIVTAINVALGVVVGVALYVVGMPNAALWGVMACFLNFMPYIGALIGVGVVTVISAITFDGLVAAAVPPLVYLTCTVLEGQFITPSILGRGLSLNPLFVFLAVVVWSWMWGIAGAFLAVPLLVCLRALLINVEPLAALGDLLGPGRGVGTYKPGMAFRKRRANSTKA
jgi:predicted PurR-regulated permease PerM